MVLIFAAPNRLHLWRDTARKPRRLDGYILGRPYEPQRNDARRYRARTVCAAPAVLCLLPGGLQTSPFRRATTVLVATTCDLTLPAALCWGRIYLPAQQGRRGSRTRLSGLLPA